MAMSDWNEKTRLIVTIAIMGVVNLGVWYFAYAARGDWEAKDSALKKLKVEVETKEAVAATRTDKENELKTLTRENERRSNMLPEKRERTQFFEVLADRANKTGLVPKTVTPNYDQPFDAISGAGDGGRFKRDIYQSTYKADFKGLVTFLNGLEELYPRFVSFDNLNISASDGGMGITGTKHQVSFIVATYRYERGEGP